MSFYSSIWLLDRLIQRKWYLIRWKHYKSQYNFGMTNKQTKKKRLEKYLWEIMSQNDLFLCVLSLIHHEFEHTTRNCLMFPPHATSWRKPKARLTSAPIEMATLTNMSLGKTRRGTLDCDLTQCATCQCKLKFSSITQTYWTKKDQRAQKWVI